MTTLAECARRIAELEAENAALRAELARRDADEARRRKVSGYAARRNALIAQGRWQPYVPAAQVREHVERVLAATGMSRAQFAVIAGVDDGTLCKIFNDGGARVKTEVAKRITAVTAAAVPVDSGFISALGSCRRLRALTAAGWSPAALAERLGTGEDTLRAVRDGSRDKVNAATARAIRDLYDQLWNTPAPAGTKAERVSASKSRRLAERRGWVPAGGWDEDEIDRPDGKPAEDWKRAPERKYRDRAVLAAEAAELFGFGLGRDAAAERLGVTRAALDKALERYAAAEASEAA